MPINPIPDAYRTPTPYLIVNNAAKAIAFYTAAFDAVELVRLADPSGKVMHAEIRIGGAPLMLADEFPELDFRGPQSTSGSAVSILLYVADMDAQFAKAIAAGAQVTMPLQDHFDGDRRGTLTDPFGHRWLLASKQEEVSLAEMQRRFAAMMKSGST